MNENKAINLVEEELADSSILNAYAQSKLKKKIFIFLMILAIVLVVLLAVTIGPIEMTVKDAYQVILHHLWPSIVEPVQGIIDGVVWKVRVPRVLTGLFVGFGLAISGAVMQPILRNPMATPYTLGVSSSAGFGAALAILLGHRLGNGIASIMMSAFAFSLLVVFVIALISKWNKARPEVIILTGIALSYLFNAGIRLLQYIVDPIYTKEMVFWLAGSLYKGTWENLSYISLTVVILSALIIFKSKDLNAICAGDEVAQSVGIDVEKTRLFLLVAASLLTAVLVSFTGTIGFIGLVGPHITRMVLDGDNFFVIVGSGFVGALLLVTSDVVAMNIIAPTILPIGVITAFMGVPLFLYLILKMKRGNF